MKRFLAKLWLWWNGYCTKHLVEKKMCCAFYDVYSWCEECDVEAQIAHQNRVMDAIRTIKEQHNG